MEYLVRAARVTDIDRIVALSDDVDADRPVPRARSGRRTCMRQLVYLPQASIVVAESQRVVVGGAILALRPSVRAGGYVGTIDLLVVDPEHDADRITEALLEELLRSASNKGCTVVEAERPDDATLLRAGSGWASPKPVPASIEPWPRRVPPRVAPYERPRRAACARRPGATLDHQGVIVSKNVAVFVDVANIFYAAKAAGVDIDYVTLLKAAIRRPRPRARLRLHRARPGQREPAQLP